MLDKMNCLAKATLMFALPSALLAQNRLQFGPHLGGVGLSGALSEGLEPSAWGGAQVRFDLGRGHVLQALVAGTRLSGTHQEVFRIDDGYHYEVPLKVSLNATIAQLGGEYHYFPTATMGRGFHTILGLGLVYSSQEKELPRYFDMAPYTEVVSTGPELTLGFGYSFTRWLGLDLRAVTFKGDTIGTQLDPRTGELNRRSRTSTLFTLSTSFFFR